MHGEMHVEPSFPETPCQDIRTSLATLLNLKGWNLARSLRHCERLLLEAALQKTNGNQSQAARILGITPRSVYNKLHKYLLLASPLIVHMDSNVLLCNALQDALL
jgi:DNA-binding NtrC family response regulator